MADGGGGTEDRSIPGPIESMAGEPADVARGAAERLVFFSDAVVAIAITLLAIELPVPEGDSTTSLLDSLGTNSIAYLTFLISFLVIGAHWQSHHRVFRYLRRVDGAFVPLRPLRARAGAAADLLRPHAVDRRTSRAVRARFATRRGRPFRHQFLGILGFLGSIPLYPVLGAWAFALWAVIPNLPQLAGAARRRRPSSPAA